MNQTGILKLLENHKAIIKDTHVVYTSGKHGNAYVNKDAIYPYTTAISSLCKIIAEHFANEGIEVVAAPAMGGIILSQWVAHHLSNRNGYTIAVYAEKDETGNLVFRRGYDKLINSKKVLVVEDILTTGNSIKSVIQAVRANEGNVIGAAALCNRGAVMVNQIGNPPELYCLTEISLEAWDEDKCPLCASGVPINTDVGKGHEFMLRKA